MVTVPYPYNLTEPTQTSTIDTFASNTAENINSRLRAVFAEFFTIDLTSSFGLPNFIPAAGFFDVTNDGTTLVISKGIAVIDEMMIETKAAFSLPTTDAGFWLDSIPVSNGTYKSYLVMRYDPDIALFVYFGMLSNYSTLTSNPGVYLLIAIVELTISGGLITGVSGVHYRDPDSGTPSVNVAIDGDAGWINTVPSAYIGVT